MSDDWRVKVGGMERAEMDDLLAQGIVCRLAVLDEAGWPYVVPVWFEWDPEEGIFWIVPRKRSAWAAYMTRDPRVALTIDTSDAPYRKVVVQGTAEVVETPNVGGRWVEIARRMTERYLGHVGPDYLDSTRDEPRWLFKVRPIRLVTWQGGDWHPKYREGRA
jgi:PPOX class probable F420-dependent enzyme